LKRENYARGGIIRIERSGALHFITTYYTMFSWQVPVPFRHLMTRQYDSIFVEGQTNRTNTESNRGTWLVATYNTSVSASFCLFVPR